jgi:hypothetical protein
MGGNWAKRRVQRGIGQAARVAAEAGDERIGPARNLRRRDAASWPFSALRPYGGRIPSRRHDRDPSRIPPAPRGGGVDKGVHVNATRRSALRCGKPGHWSLGMPCQSAAEMVPKMALKLPSRRVVETRGQRHPMRPCELAQVASPRMLHLAVSFRQVRLRREKPDHIKGW